MKRVLWFSRIQEAWKSKAAEAKCAREGSIDHRSSIKCLVILESMYGILRNHCGRLTVEDTVLHLYFHVISHEQ